MKSAMKISICNGFLGFAVVAALSLMSAGPASAAPPRHPAATLAQPQQTAAADSDHTLAAMQDELDRARTRLELTIPGTNEPARPYYIQYRVLDLDVRTIVAEFGALVSSTRGRNRIMSVDVRVGTIISTARISSPMKASPVSSARRARSGSTAITIPCARISGSPPISRSKPPSRIFPRSRRSCRAWRRRPAFPIFLPRAHRYGRSTE